MSYLSKIVATFGIAASAGIIGTVSASADTVTVKAGDTLNKIAQANNTDADTLASINHITNKNLIYVGDTIEVSTPSTKNVATYAPTQEYVAPTATTASVTTTTQADTTVQPATSTVATSDALNALINRESGGNTSASNGQYYGIGQLSPQARAMYGGNSSDYNDQLNAMKSYITARYGTAENALAHSNTTGWY